MSILGIPNRPEALRHKISQSRDHHSKKRRGLLKFKAAPPLFARHMLASQARSKLTARLYHICREEARRTLRTPVRGPALAATTPTAPLPPSTAAAMKSSHSAAAAGGGGGAAADPLLAAEKKALRRQIGAALKALDPGAMAAQSELSLLLLFCLVWSQTPAQRLSVVVPSLPSHNPTPALLTSSLSPCTNNIQIPGDAIARHVLSSRAFASARSVGVYVSCERLREPSTAAVLEAALARGKRVYVPRVDDRSSGMRLLRLGAVGELIEVPPFGILEPPVEDGSGAPREDGEKEEECFFFS